MKVKPSLDEWIFLIVWVLISTMGMFLGFCVGFVLAHVPGDLIAGALGDCLAYGVLVVVSGFGVSVLQWLILREYVSRAGWWVLAGTAGLAVAWGCGCGVAVMALGYSENLESFAARLGWTVVAALGGAVAGILQWLVLRGQVSRAGWWVLASTVGWGLSNAVAGEFSRPLVGGAVLGAVTGGALVWLLRQPVPEA